MNLCNFREIENTIAPRARTAHAGIPFGRHAAGALVLLAAVPTLATALTVAPTGELAARRFSATTSVLSDGRILVAGGLGSPTTSSAIEIYDPARGGFSGSGLLLMTEPRQEAVAVPLPNGKVLIAGGRETVGSAASLRSAELFDPVNGQSSSTGFLITRRHGATATLLSDGRVLIAGGTDGGDGGGVGGDPGVGGLASAEIYDPVSGTFSAASGTMSTRRTYASAVLTADGRVLIAGGYDEFNGTSVNTSELFDPTTETFGNVATLPGGGRQNATLTLLTDQTALLAGGSTGSNAYTATALLYRPGPNDWVAVGAMASARANAGAVLLPNGRVLVIGGQSARFAATASIESFNPTTGTFTTEAPLATARSAAAVGLLPSGRILVAGGYVPPPNINQGGTILASSELLDQSVWTSSVPIDEMTTPRAGAVTSPLLNGRVLFAGGRNGTSVLASAEVYNEANATFSATGPMAQAREAASAALLADGSVIIVGGRAPGGAPLASAERFNPQNQTFSTNARPLWQARHSAGSALLADGRLLVVGGSDANGPLASAETFDGRTGMFRTAGPLASARAEASTVLLPDGSVLVAGGQGSGGPLSSAERFDPSTRSFIPVSGSLTTARRGAMTALLPNGKVLIVGGRNAASSPLASAELYDPQTDAFAPAGSLAIARADAAIIVLPVGVVLVAGGTNATGTPLATTEVFDPATASFAPGPALTSARALAGIALTPYGRVLVAGGNGASGTQSSADVKLRSAFADVRSDQRPSFDVTSSSLTLPGYLDLAGFGLRGSLRFPNESVAGSEGSSGSAGSAPTNAPQLRLQRIDNQQMIALAPDASVPWSDLAYRTTMLNRHDPFDPATTMAGVYRVYINANGVNSSARIVTMSWVEDSLFASGFEAGE